MPAFTVITATWNRSRHISPTIRSVLAQTCTDFEYLVVGDCCSDDTEDVVRAIADPRLRWLSTSERWKSQSGPNNLGIELARGDFIAYIGHDDIWAPDHLARHLQNIQQNQTDFSVAGSVIHGCPGTGIVYLCGLFDAGKPLNNHMFPPSSMAHRRDVTKRIGPWRRPDDIDDHVDTELLRRAVAAGMSFAPTGQITAHKFSAAHRYLSYLQPESDEQLHLLARMNQLGFGAELAAWVAASKLQGSFFPDRVVAEKTRQPARFAAISREARGVGLPPPAPLRRTFVVKQSDVFAGSDWARLAPGGAGFRWSGPNPAPRVLLPVTATSAVLLQFKLLHADPTVFPHLQFFVNGSPVAAGIRKLRKRGKNYCATATIHCSLNTEKHTILRIFHPEGSMTGPRPARRRGVAMGTLTISASGPTALKRHAGFLVAALASFVSDLKSLLPVAARRKNP